jgi:hypothetical protein
VPTVTTEAIAMEYQAEMTWRAQVIGKPGVLSQGALRAGLERRTRGAVPASWEDYWSWVDTQPDALRPRSADL